MEGRIRAWHPCHQVANGNAARRRPCYPIEASIFIRKQTNDHRRCTAGPVRRRLVHRRHSDAGERPTRGIRDCVGIAHSNRICGVEQMAAFSALPSTDFRVGLVRVAGRSLPGISDPHEVEDDRLAPRACRSCFAFLFAHARELALKTRAEKTARLPTRPVAQPPMLGQRSNSLTGLHSTSRIASIIASARTLPMSQSSGNLSAKLYAITTDERSNPSSISSRSRRCDCGNAGETHSEEGGRELHS